MKWFLLWTAITYAGWVANFIKLNECDFEAPYKCELVHLAGLHPSVGWVTGWIKTETK